MRPGLLRAVIARRLPAGLLAVCTVAVLFLPLGCSRAEELAGSPLEAGHAKGAERKPSARKRMPAYGIQAWHSYRLRRPDFRLIRKTGAGFYRFNLLTSRHVLEHIPDDRAATAPAAA